MIWPQALYELASLRLAAFCERGIGRAEVAELTIALSLAVADQHKTGNHTLSIHGTGHDCPKSSTRRLRVM